MGEKPEDTACIYMGTSCADAIPKVWNTPNETVQLSSVLLTGYTECNNGASRKNTAWNWRSLLSFYWDSTRKERISLLFYGEEFKKLGWKTWSKNQRILTEIVRSLDPSLSITLRSGKYLRTEISGIAFDHIWGKLVRRKEYSIWVWDPKL